MIVQGDEDVLVPAHLNFGKFMLDRLRNAKPDDTCLVNGDTGERQTYGEFAQLAVRLSSALAALGVAGGAVVAVAGEARAAFLPAGLAAVLAGAAFTPIELDCGRAILSHKFNLTKPKYVICSRLFWEAYGDTLKGFDFIKTFICFDEIEDIELSVKTLTSRHVDVGTFEPAAVRGATDVAVVVYSSGTTGPSKGVLLTHLNCIARINIACYYGSESVETCYVMADLYNAYTIFMIYNFLSTGKRIVHSRNEIDLKILQDYKANTVPTVPVGVEDMLNAERADKYDLTSLKTVYSTGAHLQPTLRKAFKQRYPNIKLLHVYGATEVAAITVQIPSDIQDTTVGIVAPGVMMKVVDVETRANLGPNQHGEICVRSPCLMKGYLGSSSPYLDEQGFYLTGDLGYYDDHKRVYLVDRLNDVISHCGYKVCPGDVEAVLLRHPAVREAAVVGKPAGARGEDPVAFVALRPGARAAEDELVDYVAREVTSYMRLAGGVRFVAELPRNGMKKVLRRRLKEMLELDHSIDAI